MEPPDKVGRGGAMKKQLSRTLAVFKLAFVPIAVYFEDRLHFACVSSVDSVINTRTRSSHL